MSERRSRGRSPVPRQDAEDAYASAVRTASRASLLGALGFGIALLTGLRMAGQSGFFAQGFGLDLVLFAGGIGGGLAFTALALRASRVARACRAHLDRSPSEKGRGS